MPVTSDAIQKNSNGSDFYFIVLSKNAQKLLYATYLGGGTSGTHVDGGTCRFDKHGVVYHSVCAGCWALNSVNHSTSDFPTTARAWSNVNGSINCNNAAFKFDLSSLKARIQTNSISFDHPGLTQVCLNDRIVFQNKSVGGQFYDWNLGDGSIFTKLDTLFLAHQYASEGKYVVKLKIFDIGTCSQVDSTQVTVNVFKQLGMAGPDQTICFNAGTQLVASGGVSYEWITTDHSFSSTNAQPAINPTATTTYFVTITDLHGCVVKDTVNVKVIPSVDIKMKVDRVFDCLNRPTLVANNLSDSQENLFFDFGDGSTSDQPKVTHVYQKDGTYVVKLVSLKEGCVFEQAQNVPVYQVLVPNVFTPEQTPGANDSFKIKYGDFPIVPGEEPPVQISLRILNRWGKVVYTNTDYRNDWTAKEVDAGTYYYEASLVGEARCKGWVQVIK
jgi:PKD repeat protein